MKKHFIFIILMLLLYGCTNLNNLKSTNIEFLDVSQLFEKDKDVEKKVYTDLYKYENKVKEYFDEQNPNKYYAILYDGEILCYDKDNNLIKKENSVEVLCLNSEFELIQNGYNIKNYLFFDGAVVCNSGFVKIKDDIYYTDKNTHKWPSYFDVDRYSSLAIDGIDYLFNDGKLVINNTWHGYYSDENGIIIKKPGKYENENGFVFVYNSFGEIMDNRENNYVYYDDKFYVPCKKNNKIECNNYWQLTELTLNDIYNELLINKNTIVINNGAYKFDKNYNIKNFVIPDLKYNIENEDKFKYRKNGLIEYLVSSYSELKRGNLVNIKVSYSKESYEQYGSTENKIAFLKEDGNFAYDEIIEYKKKKYYFDYKNSLQKNNIVECKNQKYLIDENGVIIEKEGIYKISNIHNGVFSSVELFDSLMSFDYPTILYKNSFIDSYCYVNNNGKVEYCKLLNLNGKWYYADAVGKLLRDTWLNNYLYFDIDCNLDITNLDMSSSNINKIEKQIICDDLNNNLYNKRNITNYKIEKLINDENLKNISKTEFCNSGDMYLYNMKDEPIREKYVNLGPYSCFTDLNGKIEKDKIINIEDRNYIIDIDGRVVKDRWIFDHNFHNDANLNKKINPYVDGYRLNRKLAKKYDGYYVLGSGEILDDDIAVADCKYSELTGVINFKNKEFKYNDKLRLLADGLTFDGLSSLDCCVVDEFEEGNIEEMSVDFHYTGSQRWALYDYYGEDADLYMSKIANEYIEKVKSHEYATDMIGRIYFGSYYLDDINGKTKNYILWDILGDDGKGNILLLSRNVIKRSTYNKDWSTSEIRSWLNNDFYNEAFTNDEKKIITSKSYIDNDNVFILDSKFYYYSEIDNYRPILNPGETRYSQFQFKDDIRKAYNEYVWCRDGKKINKDFNTFDSQSNEINGIRPAIWIKANKFLDGYYYVIGELNDEQKKLNKAIDLYYKKILDF